MRHLTTTAPQPEPVVPPASTAATPAMGGDMTQRSEVEAFERWASAPPREWSVHVFPDDPYDNAWPGQYSDYRTQAAWEAWEQRAIICHQTGEV